ncbi:diguanylate cyclase (GGDEF) domain-containing protein [Pseudonocardia thermophila]|jgi:diguanylate cyclase (GGDEF) domain|uniref:Diguanylate cyclase (GGDEF) domain-containing protein n=1 Tax=Pseudonocardia thermophila TaxID=1848 RepID=A0A1M6VRT7_PSETH|nr:GGDEF domain-containing protein [Pseudonocardia thermophila]SHK84094.1 diguanylate cyclase (GGDEF) domain-containing protein [Pseudonocardia thermophila]
MGDTAATPVPETDPGPALRRLPRRAVAGVLAVEAIAVLLVIAAGFTAPAPEHAGYALLLVALSVVHTELATGIERVRRRIGATSYFDLSSVWTFAAAMLLPPLPAALVIVVVYAHLWKRVWRPARVPLYRHVYTTATVVLAALAAQAVVHAFGGLPASADDPVGVLGLALAVLVYELVNTSLVALAIALSARGEQTVALRRLLGQWDDNVLELATLCMGALAAVALAHTPWLAVLALPPILVLHRAVLVRHYETAASTDGKTGLYNAASWQGQARRAMRRSERSGTAVGVLILDLDHFKNVNDRYGHLAGDQVLASVAAVLRSCVRDDDVVGRFGGEEFVVLLPGLDPGAQGRAELLGVAERLRSRVEELDLAVDTPDGPMTLDSITVSVGAALSGGPTSVEHLLKAADGALYAAKRGGRNQVRAAGALLVGPDIADARHHGAPTIPAPRTPDEAPPAGARRRAG